LAVITVLAQYYHPAFNAGGPVPGIRNAVRSLSGHSVRVVTRDRDLGNAAPFGQPYVGTTVVDEAEVTYLPPLSVATSRRWLRSASRVLGGDAVYVNSLFSTYFAVLPLLMLFATRYRGRVAIAPRGELAQSARVLGRSGRKRVWLAVIRGLRLDRSAGRRGNVVWLASSTAEQRDIALMFPRATVYVSPETLRSTASGGPIVERPRVDELELVCVARLAPVKGVLDLFEGLSRVTVPVRLRLVGPPEDLDYVSQLKSVERRFPAAVRVSWLGGLPADEVSAELRASDFSVLLSRGENFGHSIGESLLEGCPVLISDQTPWSFVAEQNAGFVLAEGECRDPERVARRIEAMAAMSGTDRIEMARAARRCGEAGLVSPGSVTVGEALGYGSA